ncbi:uncharacterized protein B0I36DRAFT_315633 [Microdochium trichocladiopsis]|uniref:Uncharacterized protein n=1 Tax=Microdochium trichocladiopsis TaxID=1682393 RepID=A0A9P9BUH4_9PEZI|nr:uncharacterized protein B0I36DRAFT_315633 [Microdochium trichocladiopsis]KAH7038142.1 hypothetical protein B0I36DRAFT_315633 [Microdochium trichocladiopsis]
MMMITPSPVPVQGNSRIMLVGGNRRSDLALFARLFRIPEIFPQNHKPHWREYNHGPCCVSCPAMPRLTPPPPSKNGKQGPKRTPNTPILNNTGSEKSK